MTRSPEATTKACTRCKEAKDPGEFSPAPRSPDGLSSWCKACRRRDARERYHRIRKTKKPRPPARRLCSSCREIKAGSEFGRRSGNSSGMDTVCKPCRREQNRIRRRRARLRWEGPRVAEKQCPRCGKTKAAAEFHLCTSSRTGLSSWCRECYCLAQRESIESRDRRGRLLERGVLLLTRSARELTRFGDEDLAGACAEYSRRISAELKGGEAMSTATRCEPVTASEPCMINGCDLPAIAGDVLCRDHDRRYRKSCPFCGKGMTDIAIERGACGTCWQKTWVREAIQRTADDEQRRADR